MSITPTNHGYAYIFENEGSVNVAVCARIEDEKPVDVIAIHFRTKQIKVDTAVQLTGEKGARYSTAPVAVYGEDHVVHLRKVAVGEGLTAAGLRS
ncbi:MULTISPECIES: hypothetical protein [Nonomuraea]|uniref:Uncharacterized protein n=2 Tax=Nonomuraea TaxID=83681 RepID=A0ABW1BZS4_9ACTN|nr:MULTISPECIES: hypothetical protein [Nonomuraea]MDA0643019.1 hypothetical protein [Nonomuraea ferruginea]TXK39872.1 hypothetical protein FR742_09975 [Nonomuraea sp. C10]